MVSNEIIDENWYIDSAATSHMFNNINFFKTFNSNYSESVTLANGTLTTSKGKKFHFFKKKILKFRIFKSKT